MSTTTSPAKLYKFFVYAPDKTTEGTLARRYEVRQRHLDAVKPSIDDQTIKVAGMFVAPESIDAEGTDRKAVGSMFILEAESLAVARKMMEEDIYYTSGVWDPEKLVVLPFVAATKLP